MKAKKSSCSNAPFAWALASVVTAAACAAWPVAVRAAGGEGQPAGPAKPAVSADEEPTPKLRGMDERVSLDLRSTEAADALKYLATKGGLNIAIGKNVSGRVNLFLTDVPIRDVFDLILRSNELAYDKQGDVYNIMTETEYRALYGKKFADLRKVKTFRLQYAIPQQAFNLLDTMKSEVGRLLVDEDSGTVLIMDTPDNLEQMQKALMTLEREGTVRVFDLKYAKAKDVEERLKDQLEISKLGYVKSDERSNQVIVKTLPDRMGEIEKVILALDRKTREVLIDAKIVKVTLTNKLNAGINWDSVFTNLKFNGLEQLGQSGQGDFRNSTTGTPPSEVPAVSKIKLPALHWLPGSGKNTAAAQNIKLGQLDFSTVARDGYELFRYLETIGTTKLLSNPRIVTTENQEARIHVGTREAYVTTTTTTGQTTTTTAEEIEFIDVGIQLLVTPLTINDDGYINMKIRPEVSSVIRTLTTPSKNQIPIVDTSIAETHVLIKDGSTIVIGGLRKDEHTNSDDEVPGIGRVPIVGNLFKRKSKNNELAELVVFITPHIVQGDELITGDEPKLSGGAIKSYRGYDSLLKDDAKPAAPNKSLTTPDPEKPPMSGQVHF